MTRVVVNVKDEISFGTECLIVRVLPVIVIYMVQLFSMRLDVLTEYRRSVW